MAYRKGGKCSVCGSKDRRYDQYTRAWNDLCQQAAGEAGYYCMKCHHIDFHTPDFEKWLEMMPRWIVRSKGDAWRKAAEHGVEPTCPTCGKNLNTENHSPDCTYYKPEAAHASRWADFARKGIKWIFTKR